MDPGVRGHGVNANSPGQLWSKYECFLMGSCLDIHHLRNFNAKLGRKFHERDGITNERTNIRMDERKGENYIPVGINAGGIIILDI